MTELGIHLRLGPNLTIYTDVLYLYYVVLSSEEVYHRRKLVQDLLLLSITLKYLFKYFAQSLCLSSCYLVGLYF